MRPAFVTFTGLDENTDALRVREISARYPVEWGILFSPERTGVDPRYPQHSAIEKFFGSGIRLSAHLCGNYPRAVIGGGHLPGSFGGFISAAFDRIQFNIRGVLDQPLLHQFADVAWGLGARRAILQCREPEFPISLTVDWLFDRSGGRGEAPDRWPSPSRATMPSHLGVRHGYAGGIGPDTIDDTMRGIILAGRPKNGFWIDMETRVRTDGYLDLDKCEFVLRALYPDK